MKYALTTVTDAFLTTLRAERDVSPHTLTAYGSDLGQFSEWSQRGRITDLRKVDRKHLRRYVAYLTERSYARRTIARKISAVRSMLRWAVLHDLIPASPAEDLGVPKLDRPLPKGLRAADAARLVDLPPIDDPIGLRDRAILELLYGSGLRVAELCALDVDDVDLRGGAILVMGKGRKQRRIPIGEPTRAAFDAYLPARLWFLERGPGTDQAALFINRPRAKCGRPASKAPADTVENDVRSRRCAAGQVLGRLPCVVEACVLPRRGGQVFGRLPWLAAFFLRSRRLRARLDMVTPSWFTRGMNGFSHVVGFRPHGPGGGPAVHDE